jgi:hypothetical protein
MQENDKQTLPLQQNNCMNCGHASHCGAPLWKDFRREPYNHGIEGQIKVCGHCRCGRCSK